MEKKRCKSKFQKNISSFGLEILWVSHSTPEVIFDREPVQEEWTRLKWSGRTATDIRLASPSLTPKSDYWSKIPPRQRSEIPQRSAGSYSESLGIRVLGTALMSACGGPLKIYVTAFHGLLPRTSQLPHPSPSG